MTKPILLALLLTGANLAPVLAQEPAAPPADPTDQSDPGPALGNIVTPQAQAVIDRMTASLGALKHFDVKASITRDEVLSYGYKLQHGESARMWLRWPDQMRVEVDGDVKNATYVFDGKRLTIASPENNVYAVTDAPGTTRDLVEVLQAAGVEMPLIDLLYHGALGSLIGNVRAGLLVGETEVDGVAVDHLAFRQPDVDWQLWVQQGEHALPRKLVITTRYAVGDPQYEAVLTWDTTTVPAAERFTFAPDADDMEVAFAGSLANTGGGQ